MFPLARELLTMKATNWRCRYRNQATCPQLSAGSVPWRKGDQLVDSYKGLLVHQTSVNNLAATTTTALFLISLHVPFLYLGCRFRESRRACVSVYWRRGWELVGVDPSLDNGHDFFFQE